MVVCMSYNLTSAIDRLISALSYTLPLFKSLQSIPYASFVALFTLYLGVEKNPSFSDYVRFKGIQAVNLGVLLALPLLVTRIFNPDRRGLGLQIRKEVLIEESNTGDCTVLGVHNGLSPDIRTIDQLAFEEQMRERVSILSFEMFHRDRRAYAENGNDMC